jgi:hypothetical protein
VPRSPETNLLGLGVWRSIQAAVVKEHLFKLYDEDALTRSVKRAWENRLSADVFARVYGRLIKVLQLIQADNGGNNLVEEQRGKLFTDPVDLTRDDNDGADEGDDDLVDED